MYWNDSAYAFSIAIFTKRAHIAEGGYIPELKELRGWFDAMLTRWWMTAGKATMDEVFPDAVFSDWLTLGSIAAGIAEQRGMSSSITRASTELSELLCRKQRDYGHENIGRFGRQGLLVRVHDKIARLENLSKSGQDPENESIMDNILDVIGYCCIGMMVEAGTFFYELKP